MDSKYATGFCIVCKREISQNVNAPICNNCNISFPHRKITDWIDGDYCHICGISTNVSNHYPRCKKCEGFDRDSDKIDDHYLTTLAKYKRLKQDELIKIEPLWACGEHKIQCIRTPKNSVLTQMEVRDIINETQLSHRFDTICVFNNEVKSNKRILNTLERWSGGLCVDPPNIVQQKELHFADGQHRILAALFLQVKSIPVFLTSE